MRIGFSKYYDPIKDQFTFYITTEDANDPFCNDLKTCLENDTLLFVNSFEGKKRKAKFPLNGLQSKVIIFKVSANQLEKVEFILRELNCGKRSEEVIAGILQDQQQNRDRYKKELEDARAFIIESQKKCAANPEFERLEKQSSELTFKFSELLCKKMPLCNSAQAIDEVQEEIDEVKFWLKQNAKARKELEVKKVLLEDKLVRCELAIKTVEEAARQNLNLFQPAPNGSSNTAAQNPTPVTNTRYQHPV